MPSVMFPFALSVGVAGSAFVLAQRRVRWIFAIGVAIAAALGLAGPEVAIPVGLMVGWLVGHGFGRASPRLGVSPDRGFSTGTAWYLMVFGMTMATFLSRTWQAAATDAHAVVAFVVNGWSLLVGGAYVVATWPGATDVLAATRPVRRFVHRGLAVGWLGLAVCLGCDLCRLMVAILGGGWTSCLVLGIVLLAVGFLTLGARVLGPDARRHIAGGACGAMPFLFVWSAGAIVPVWPRNYFF